MVEIGEGFIAALGVFISLVFSVLWMFGGRPGGRIIRRWVSPLFFSVSLILYSLNNFNLLNLLIVPGYVLVAHLGYGGDELIEKFVRRLFWAFAFASVAVIPAIISGAYVIFGIQAVICIMASVIFGLFNPFKSSAKEELLIAFSSSFLVPFIL